jgi:hypothetical protein
MDGLGQTRALDARIAELAERQHGVVARRQLLELGVGEESVEWRLRMGRLHRLHRGVYAVGHRVRTRQARWMAAVLFCGPNAVLSHRSAATLWRIRGPASRAIEVTGRPKSRSRGSIQRHRANLHADEVTVREGIPVTTPPRTLLDLATVLSVDQVEQALRQAERLSLYDGLSIAHLLARHPKHRGNGAIRECLRRYRDLPAGVTREELERRFLSFLRGAGLPRPRLNAWIDLNERRYQVDCLWEGARTVVELDGFATHGTRSAFESDRERDRRLRVEGWTVVRVTWRQLRDDGAAIATDLHRLLS